jgi:hypothetical protein
MQPITEIQKNSIKLLPNTNNNTKKTTFQTEFEKSIPLEVVREKLLKKVKELWSK